MKNLNQLLALTGVALTLAFSGVGVMAQGGFGGGGFGGGVCLKVFVVLLAPLAEIPS